MTYVSLYRRYRPQTFDEVVGQDHVTRTLVNAIGEGRLHHAYLFSGPRGTGKTSTARILAKAVNCADGPTPRPCGTCDSCAGIADGTSIDVIELDMASHGGVDDARELRDRALFAPAQARRKVYILDEVHMASTAAFNALLKLVEEPPSHVLFAMATTDPQKVLPTILSRVQRLDLRRIDAGTVAGEVRRICEAEGYEIDPAAVDAVVRAGDGSLRDTLSVLEQVLAYSDGEITHAMVSQVLGITPDEHAIRVVDLLADADVGGVLSVVQELVDEGHDLRRFTLDLAQHARDLLVLKVASERPDLVDATEERRHRLATQADALDQPAILDVVRVLAQTLTEQRQTNPRLPLELALATLATRTAVADGGARTPAVDEPTADVPDPAPASSLDEAPRPAAEGDVPEPVHAGDAPDPGQPLAAADPEETAEVPSPNPAEADEADEAHDTEPVAPAPSADEELETIRSRWDAVLDEVKQQSRRCHALFEPAVPVRAGRGVLTLRYARRYGSFHATNARKAEFADVLSAALQARCGVEVRIDVVVEGDDDRRRPVPPSVTPADARTPVFDDAIAGTARAPADPGPGTATEAPVVEDDEQQTDVREAEVAPAAVSAQEVGRLLSAELGAELVEEREPPDDSGASRAR